jgi:predicted  nucleic acid-binding Zn-ribbon protein
MLGSGFVLLAWYFEARENFTVPLEYLLKRREHERNMATYRREFNEYMRLAKARKEAEDRRTATLRRVEAMRAEAERAAKQLDDLADRAERTRSLLSSQKMASMLGALATQLKELEDVPDRT